MTPGKDFTFIDQKVKFEGKWLRFLEYEYLTPEGQKRSWELAERTTRQGSCDAVDILAILKKSGEPEQIVLVKQYRPPLKSWTIEMPAGLVDENETPEVSAVRELKEETGYKGIPIGNADPVIVSDPGLTNATLQMMTLVIDLDLQINQNVKPAIEDQYIETLILPIKTLKESLDALIAKGFHVDSRLYHFAAGIAFASQI